MTSERTRMRMVERLRAAGVRDESVLAAMASIPRHIFVDEALSSRAYEDMSLPLGHGQTISQPLHVARMCELARGGPCARPRARDRHRLRLPGRGALAARARGIFGRAHRARCSSRRACGFCASCACRNVRMKLARRQRGSGRGGAVRCDRDRSGCDAKRPALLLEQLAPGGRMVLPLGGEQQRLCLIERTGAGFEETLLEAVRFVPLLSGTLR